MKTTTATVAATLVGVLSVASTASAASTSTKPVYHQNVKHESTVVPLKKGKRLYTGTARNVSTAGFTLTQKNGHSYTVQLGVHAIVWTKKRKPMSLSNVRNGDSIRLDGVLSASSTITASIVRDMSR